MRRLILLSVVALFAVVSPAVAHYQMLLTPMPSAKKDQPVTIIYQWGHPFEHQLFDAPPPQRVVVIAPDGKVSDQTKALEKIGIFSTNESKDKVTGYRLQFKPDQRGDYVIVLQTPPIWMKDEGEYWQDTVKMIVHVQAQKGWDHNHKEDFELMPLTRPYGLQPGMVFQARILEEMKLKVVPKENQIVKKPALVPLSGAFVEVERYNVRPPKELPPDEQITRTLKTDPNGVLTCTLTDAGWWCITTGREAGVKDHDGKNYPVRQRSTLWVYVDEKPGK